MDSQIIQLGKQPHNVSLTALASDAFFSVKKFQKQESRVVHKVKHIPSAPPPLISLGSHCLDELASSVLDVIHRYGQHVPQVEDSQNAAGWLGKSMFLEGVKRQMVRGQAIRMILPAFPWKSINRVDKVTGVLPDFGEELALYRLNQICEDIKAVYPPGGRVYIATDGLVFDDVVGIPDEDTWAYSQGLVDMAREHGLENIKLLRVMDILGYTEGRTLEKELYLSLAQKCREELLAQYGRTEEEIRQMMKDDADTLSTYCGFIRFLEGDLKFSPVTAKDKAISGSQYRKTVKKIAIRMTVRAESFTKLLQARCPDYVRMSIHPSTGKVKLSIPLIVQGSGEFPRSPWHSSTAVAVDGSYSTVHKRDVLESHDLVCDARGRPYYFREKCSVWDWLAEDADIVCEPRYPNRLVISPATADLVGVKRLSPTQLEKLAALKAAHTAGPVQTVGFAST